MKCTFHGLAPLLSIAVALQALNVQPRTRAVTWADLTPLRTQLESRGVTTETFADHVERIRDSNVRRVREGDLDHLVFYLLQSTRFTKLPPIEPALSAKALVEGGGATVPDSVRARVTDLLRALESSHPDPRVAFFRDLVITAFPERRDREKALHREYLRAMKFLYEQEFVAQRSERPTEAVAELYRKRGLSTDTAVEAGFLLHQGLSVAKALEPERRIRRVLIVGPGLDLAPRTGFLEEAPPASYQPWAVIDALLSLGLSRPQELEVVGADINMRVVEHLRGVAARPPLLTLMTGIQNDQSVRLSDEYREYFAGLGRALGQPRPVTDRHKTVRVGDAAARALRAESLDVITEHLAGAPFDLVIATNVLPYFDDLALMLALSNIGRMLAAGGLFLHNEARPLMHELTSALGFPVDQSRHVTIATVAGAPPLMDSVFIHRKPRSATVAHDARRPDSPSSARSGTLGFSFTDVAEQAGLTARTIYGAQGTNTYLIETTGTGVAVLDYDADGWLDVFLVNGTVLQGSPKGQEPTNHLYRNRGDGTFEDVTGRTGVAHSGWGQGACVGDYDDDGFDDLYVTYWGQNRLYRNTGRATFEDATRRAGMLQAKRRWSTSCAFLDYDRDGRLDLIVANYIDFDPSTTPLPSAGLCRYKGLAVACGPSGLPGATNILYRNRGDGTFTDVSAASGVTGAKGTYGLGVATLDFDDDGWVDVYVANDSNPSTLYRNNRDGTFTDIGITAGCAYSQDGKPQAGMGIAVGDYDRNGTMDIFKTNFAGDTSTLYANTGKGVCEDRTFASGIGVNTRWLGWGVGFLDLDGDAWLDLFLVNGHVYPEVDRLKSEAGYKQPKVVYRNLRNGRFADVTAILDAPVTIPKAARGAAFADVDNDGDVDVIVNNVHDTPDLFRLDRAGSGRWLTLKLVGTASNRSAIGARVRVVTDEGEQRQEVRGGGSYYSQSDLRVHFGLGTSTVERIVIRWPNGQEESWTGLEPNRAHTLIEGKSSQQAASRRRQ